MKRISILAMLVAGLFIGQVAQAEETESDTSHFWGGVNVKYWMLAYKPGNLAATNISQIMPTVAVGYDKFFYTLTFSGTQTVSNSAYPGGEIQFQEESSGFGYNINSNIAVVLGYRFFGEIYSTNLPNRTAYTTLAALFNWNVPDSKATLFGSIGAGSGQVQNSNYTNASHPYSGYEIGVSYPVATSTKVSLGYRIEQFELPYGTTSAAGTAQKSGLFLGAGYSF